MKKVDIIKLIIKELNKNSFINYRNIYANNIDFESETKNDYNYYETEQFLYNHEDSDFSAAINIFDYNFETELLEVYDYTKRSEGNLQYFTLKELNKAAEFIVRSIKDKEFQISEEYNQIEKELEVEENKENFDFDKFIEDKTDEAIDNLNLLEAILLKRFIREEFDFDDFFEDKIEEAIDNSNLKLLETILVKRMIEKDREFLEFKSKLRLITNKYNIEEFNIKINSNHDLTEVLIEVSLQHNNFTFTFN